MSRFLTSSLLLLLCISRVGYAGQSAAPSLCSKIFTSSKTLAIPSMQGTSNALNQKDFEGRTSQIKFVIAKSHDQILFLDSRQYQFHSDPFILESLRGIQIPNVLPVALGQYRFLNISQAASYYEMNSPRIQLPEGLSWRGHGLLKSREFDNAVRDGRLILGSVLREVSDGQVKLIAEFNTGARLTADEVQMFLENANKAEDGLEVYWRPIGRLQERLAENILATESKWKNRVLAPSQQMQNTSEVYSAGSADGKLRYFKKGEYAPYLVKPTDIIVLEELPDELPPVRGVITLVPQTPQAHINLLALNQGIPNVFIQPGPQAVEIISLAQRNSAIHLNLYGNDISWKLIEKNVRKNTSASKLPTNAVPIDTSKLEYSYSFEDPVLRSDALDPRAIGGKAMGLLRLKSIDAKVPSDLTVVTAKLWIEATAAVRVHIQDALSNRRFANEPEVRFLFLEGVPEKMSAAQAKQVSAIVRSLSVSSENANLIKVINAGGLKGLIRSLSKNPIVVKVSEQIVEHYQKADMDTELRFRSSADSEDVHNFNSAGLYDSFTISLKSKRKKAEQTNKAMAANAILEVFASYWNFRAYEWRSQIGINHLNGSMAIVVHPTVGKVARANGVITFSIELDQTMPEQQRLKMKVNMRAGNSSVVRPELNSSPLEAFEVDEFRMDASMNNPISQIKKLSPRLSLLSQEEIDLLFQSARKAAMASFSYFSKKEDPRFRRTAWTEDLEFVVDSDRNVAIGSKIYFVQSRPLVRPDVVPPELSHIPIPRNLVTDAVSVNRRIFQTDAFSAEIFEVFTKESTLENAFNPLVRVKFKRDVLGYKTGSVLEILHTDCERITHVDTHHGPWDINILLNPASASKFGFASLDLSERGNFWEIYDNNGVAIRGHGRGLPPPSVTSIYRRSGN